MSKEVLVKDTAAKALRPESLMMSYGYAPETCRGAVKCPIFQTSTFVFESAEEGKSFFEIAYGLREAGPREEPGLIYSRLNNPDLEILEKRLTLWDGAEASAVFQSGMAAITTLLMTFLHPGDLVLHSDPLYGGTEFLLENVLPQFGIQSLGFPAGSSEEKITALLEEERPGARPALILLETPANPTNALTDIGMCRDLAGRYSTAQRKTRVAVDNTFLGPLWQHPLEHGADLVVYSATKYIGGHSDLIAGVCLGSQSDITAVKNLRTFMGNMAGPWTGWLLLRSLETLKLRMTCQMKNARYVADYLASHPKVRRVYYLGHLTPSDPGYATYRRQCLSAGAMIAFDLEGGEEEAFRFLNALGLIQLAVSLGGTESLAEHPASMTHSDLPSEIRLKMGIGPSMVRLSVGVEHPHDLIHDLAQALDRV